jgi:sodium-dependent phosphate transporter
MRLHQYDYIFAIGTLFAMLDAYNNGASEYLIHTLTLCGPD